MVFCFLFKSGFFCLFVFNSVSQLYIFVFVCVCPCTGRGLRSIKSPELTGSCELPDKGAGIELGPPEECVLLTTEPCLLPYCIILNS